MLNCFQMYCDWVLFRAPARSAANTSEPIETFHSGFRAASVRRSTRRPATDCLKSSAGTRKQGPPTERARASAYRTRYAQLCSAPGSHGCLKDRRPSARIEFPITG